MLKTLVQEVIKDALEDVVEGGRSLPSFALPVDIPVARPNHKEYGDMATPIAMSLAGALGMEPRELAERLAEVLSDSDIIEGTPKVADPGFVNIRLQNHVLQEELRRILYQGDRYGYSDEERGSVSIEFISVNPTGPLHVAHGRAAFYGDVFARALEAAGWAVLREYYVNASHHSTQIQELGSAILGEGEQYKGPLINELRERIDAEGKDATEVGFAAARIIQQHNQQFIEEVLNIPFGEWVWEETLFEDGLVDKTFAALENKEAVEKREGAVWLKHEGLFSEASAKEGWVLVRSSGAPSYLLPDIAYHWLKAKCGHARIVDIFGADHQGHEEKLSTAAELFGFRDALEVYITQMVHVVEEGEKKKMSKRAGTAVELAWLIEEVGLDAARFFFVMKDISTHMEFDIALAKEQSQKNPVYYVQYAHTRCAGIERMAEEKGKGGGTGDVDLSLLTAEEERDLIKELAVFPDVVAEVAEKGVVHRLPHYLTELADVFHHFYHQCPVLKAEDPQRITARLALVHATRHVLASGLELLGVRAPVQM